ncbi:MAG: NAD(P)-dependent oxidoreductase [Patescibacteria group bacterium]
MAILITGGTGFIGSYLVEQLKKNGNEVVLFTGDVSKKEDTQSFCSDEKIDALIHLAAIIGHKNKKFIERVNVDGTNNIIEMGRRLDVRRLIFLSSIRVLSKLNDPYIDSKRAAEKNILGSGLPYIILRPSMVYGPGDNKNVWFLLKLARIALIMPVLNFRLQPIFIEDLVMAISACIDSSANQIINMAGLEIISFETILNYLKNFGYKFWKINAPVFFSGLIRVISFLPFFPLTLWQIKTLLSDEVYKSDDWQKLLNVVATPFVKGLEATLV